MPSLRLLRSRQRETIFAAGGRSSLGFVGSSDSFFRRGKLNSGPHNLAEISDVLILYSCKTNYLRPSLRTVYAQYHATSPADICFRLEEQNMEIDRRRFIRTTGEAITVGAATLA